MRRRPQARLRYIASMALERQVLDEHVDANAPCFSRSRANPRKTPSSASASTSGSVAVRGRASRGSPSRRGTAGSPPLFGAHRSGPGPGWRILAEYDAFPRFGHACGHNLIAAGALGAFPALHAERTPLERARSSSSAPPPKKAGRQDQARSRRASFAASTRMMFHPFDRDLVAHIALASTLRIHLRGHAVARGARAVGRHERAHRVHGDVPAHRRSARAHEGRRARPRLHRRRAARRRTSSPSGHECEFSVRASTTTSSRVWPRDRRGVAPKGAALACDVEVTIAIRRGYRHMKNNMTLARRFGEHCARSGASRTSATPRGRGLDRHGGRVCSSSPPSTPGFRSATRGRPPATSTSSPPAR